MVCIYITMSNSNILHAQARPWHPKSNKVLGTLSTASLLFFTINSSPKDGMDSLQPSPIGVKNHAVNYFLMGVKI